jgi:hypothetical protein
MAGRKPGLSVFVTEANSVGRDIEPLKKFGGAHKK